MLRSQNFYINVIRNTSILTETTDDPCVLLVSAVVVCPTVMGTLKQFAFITITGQVVQPDQSLPWSKGMAGCLSFAVSQLSADNVGLFLVPSVATNSAPLTHTVDFNSTLV